MLNAEEEVRRAEERLRRRIELDRRNTQFQNVAFILYTASTMMIGALLFELVSKLLG